MKEDSHPPIIDDKDRAEQAFDQIYNQAVNHCIRIIREDTFAQISGIDFGLIRKLEQLKKP